MATTPSIHKPANVTLRRDKDVYASVLSTWQKSVDGQDVADGPYDELDITLINQDRNSPLAALRFQVNQRHSELRICISGIPRDGEAFVTTLEEAQLVTRKPLTLDREEVDKYTQEFGGDSMTAAANAFHQATLKKYGDPEFMAQMDDGSWVELPRSIAACGITDCASDHPDFIAKETGLEKTRRGYIIFDTSHYRNSRGDMIISHKETNQRAGIIIEQMLDHVPFQNDCLEPLITAVKAGISRHALIEALEISRADLPRSIPMLSGRTVGRGAT